jgi:hypothetical protein
MTPPTPTDPQGGSEQMSGATFSQETAQLLARIAELEAENSALGRDGLRRRIDDAEAKLRAAHQSNVSYAIDALQRVAEAQCARCAVDHPHPITDCVSHVLRSEIARLQAL